MLQGLNQDLETGCLQHNMYLLIELRRDILIQFHSIHTAVKKPGISKNIVGDLFPRKSKADLLHVNYT